MDESDALRQVKELAEVIARALPAKIEIAALTLESKIPFKALSLRELVIHRVSALATPAVEQFEQQRLVPAIVLTRALVETVALAFALHKRLAAFLQDHDVKALDEFLMKGIAGSRLSDAEIQSVSVLTLIKHVEKEVPGFSASYDSLSEFAHPNWAGILGAYGRIDQGAFELILGQNDRIDGMRRGLYALSGALLVFQHFYNDMFDMLHQLNASFENAKGAT